MKLALGLIMILLNISCSKGNGSLFGANQQQTSTDNPSVKHYYTDDRDKIAINFSDLPQASQDFIKKHFGDKQIAIIYKDLFDADVDYDVIFTDGSSVDFDKNGLWEEIEVKDLVGVPDAIVPNKILTFVKQKHPNNHIKEISRKFHKYDVELNNSIEIVFDKNGNFKHYDD